MSSLTTVHKERYVVRRVSSVVAYWTPMRGDTESNPGEVEIFFFHEEAMLLFYINQRITIP
jgi:hypothetical protein